MTILIMLVNTEIPQNIVKTTLEGERGGKGVFDTVNTIIKDLNSRSDSPVDIDIPRKGRVTKVNLFQKETLVKIARAPSSLQSILERR